VNTAADTLEQFLMGVIEWDALLAECAQACASSPAHRAEWLAATDAGSQTNLNPEQAAALRRAIGAAPTMAKGSETLIRGVEPVVQGPGTETLIRSVEDLGQPMTLLRTPESRPARADRRQGLRAGVVVLEKYVLEEQLGQGGMGQVWKARDLVREQAGDLHSSIALKFLNPDFESHPDAFRSLNAETRRSQELAHPFIATVYTFDLDRVSGRAFMSMELLDGQPLDVYISAAPRGRPRAEVLPILKNLAVGLAYAHSRKIVHSDFKPGNVFLTQEGKPKILDFGIARVTRDARRANEFFDAASLSALTLPYASPEMIRGEDAHPADDVYALGLVSYELLTGRHPFGSLPANEAIAAKRVPARIKGLKTREWRAVQRALAFNRADRWQDAGAFLKALDGVSPWILGLSAAAVVLAGIAGWSGYQNWLESRPRVPFESLPARVQADFREAMSQGDDGFKYGTTVLHGAEAASALYKDAISEYAKAYQLHPKNLDADRALRRSFDALKEQLSVADSSTRIEAREVLKSYTRTYQALSRYPPLTDLIASLE
jgi:serine/threonine protein kinase